MNAGAHLLPANVLVKIFSHCSYYDLVKSIQFVCTWWQDVSREKCLWKHIMYEPRGSSQELIGMLQISPQLKALNLISVTVSTELIQQIIHGCPQLERLHMFWDSIYNRVDVKITRSLAQIKILSLVCEEELYVDFDYLDLIFPNIQHLEIAVLQCKKQDLVQYLRKKQHSLHSLSLACRTQDGFCVLPCLSECTHLKKLSLSRLCDNVHLLPQEEVQHLSNISSLTLYESNLNSASGFVSVFTFFPRITELELYGCTQKGEDTFRIVALNCPILQKLNLPFHYAWHGARAIMQDHIFKYAYCLESVTHLSICGNAFITDEGVKYLQGIPQLEYLELFRCRLLTPQILKVICGFTKIEILKFDLQNSDIPADLTASCVKNRNLQIMFFNCKDMASLERLWKQHLMVCRLGEKRWWV